MKRFFTLKNATVAVPVISAIITFIANFDAILSLFFEKQKLVQSLYIMIPSFIIWGFVSLLTFGFISYLFYDRNDIKIKLENYKIDDIKFIDKLIESFRTIKLEYYQTPDKEKLIGDLIEDLKNRLPKTNEYEFRISIVEPLRSGKIKIIADYGLNEKRRQELEIKTDWKSPEKPTLYRKGILASEDFFWADNSDIDHYDGKFNPTYKNSKVHFIIPIKDEKYSTFETEGCLGVISISSPDEKAIPNDDNKNSKFYYSVYGVVKGIESILLEYKANESKAAT